MTEIGEVLEVLDGRARVKILTAEGCKTCSARGGCILAKGGDWNITAINEFRARVHERVRLVLSGRGYLAAAAILFLLPILRLAVFYAFTSLFLSSSLAVGVAFLGTAIGTDIAWWVGRGKGADRFRYKIVAILPSDSDAQVEQTAAK